MAERHSASVLPESRLFARYRKSRPCITYSNPCAERTDYRLAAAVGLFYALPVLGLFVLGQRYLLNVYSGGVKG